MRRYHIRAERDGWQILHGHVDAADEKAAKRKFRQKYQRATYLHIERVENTGTSRPKVTT